MELRSFAETVLHATSLADKLIVPESFSDETPRYTGKLPSTPGRPRNMQLPCAGARIPFPNNFEHSDDRGIAMHFFANHELMALELMALALLKLPDAQPEFRMGIAKTMLEEQKHFSLYAARAQELGVEFGDLALNSFFWDALSSMSSELDYVTQVSMTFEQANLDYALHYQQLFERIGDTACAAIMNEVYRDEVGHLAFGLKWFDRWRPPGGDCWTAYVNAMPEHLSPSWAKGIGFEERGRREAGLDDDFIRRLKVYARSKGRPPRVFYFNPDATDVESAPEVIEDLAGLLIFLAGRSDTVLSRQPTLAFLESLQRLNVVLPEIVPLDQFDRSFEPRKHVLSLCPWRWNDDAWALHDRLSERLLRPRDRDQELGRIEQARTLALAWKGSAEQHDFDGDSTVELSLHAEVKDDPTSPSMVRQLRRYDGRICGYVINRPWTSLDPTIVRYLNERRAGTGSVLDQMKELARRAQSELRNLGYRGPLALHFVVGGADEPGWRIESSDCRHTLGDVALSLSRYVKREATATWRLFDHVDVRAAGDESLAGLYSQLQQNFPLVVDGQAGQARVSSGVIATNDPALCNRVLTVLTVGQTADEYLTPTMQGQWSLGSFGRHGCGGLDVLAAKRHRLGR